LKAILGRGEIMHGKGRGVKTVERRIENLSF